MSSPLVKNSTFETLEVIQSEVICDLYMKQFGIDITSYFKNLESVEIRKCTTSNYRYYYPFTLEGDSDFYDKLSRSNSKSYYSQREWQYSLARKSIKSNDKVLDIGCGSGIFLEGLKSITTDLHGLEFNPHAIETCQAKNIDVSNKNLKDLTSSETDQYDVITYFQVLEHVADVHSFISDSIKLLKPGGKLIIAVPNNNPYLYQYDKYHVLNLPPHHLGLWDKYALSYLPNIFNLKTINISIEPLDNYGHWLRILLKKKLGFNPIPNIKIVNSFLKKIGNQFNSKIEGRNIVAIYEKGQ